jgi:alkanesulfonate monooxygenase SsuD/methylene tetrahydromethanopterin reductase-like flavin-dependent oxidoreductase (luciferase family)
MAVGFGSGSTPEEFELFGQEVTGEHERHARFEEALRLILSAWSGRGTDPDLRFSRIPAHRPLPVPAADLPRRCWLAANSAGSARIAGAFSFNMLFSHLRTPEQYRTYRAAFRDAGGTGLIAANRPVFVGPDDETAFALTDEPLRILWRRFRREGKIEAGTPEPSSVHDLCGHPINFIVGGPETVARRFLELHDQVPFDVMNVEVRWAGLTPELVRDNLRRLMTEVVPSLEDRRPRAPQLHLSLGSPGPTE